ncbi:MAG: putative transposase for insertion sequence element [Geminicoccaceae bacterium]|nr:putative transposase for insertion sequence element [Geminicoccaceae bacterium]
MYLRTTQRRNKDGSIVRYYALAENVRHPEKGHVEAKVVHSFGRADRLDRAALERLVRSIRRVLDADGSAPAADATGRERAIEIEASFDLGVVHVVEQLWARLGIGRAIAGRLAGDERQAPHEAALLAMAAQRLARPGSKLACHERWLDQVWLPAAKDLTLSQLYRALDVLAEHGDAIEEEVFWHSVDLFKLDVDLVFYDATTAWFECDEEDLTPQSWRGLTFAPLRKRGHSKEGRDNDPQVIIALAVARDGMPVRSWVLPGDTADVTTVEQIKEDLRQMRLGRALFVGDAGLYARANLAELSRGAGRYILATPIGRVKEIKDEVLSRPGRYAEITPNLRAKEVILGQGERRRRYILCLNAEEAAREKGHRDEILDLLRLELDRLASDHPKAACRLVSSRRFGPYLSLDGHGRPYIDRAKVRRAEQLDGKFVLTTNDDTLSAADIALGYKGMWIIEACFRKLKTTGLGIRPMSHWTPRRIVAHVKLCVLALMIQRAAEIAAEAPWSQLVDVLERLKAVRYTAEGEAIVQASRITPELAAILKKLDISRPKPILAVG